MLKRTKGEQFCSWLSKEVSVLKNLSTSTLSVPSLYYFIEQQLENQSWALMEYLEGETVRSALENEDNEENRHEIIFNFGKVLSAIHSTPCPGELVTETVWIDDMLGQAEFNLKNYEVDGTSELLDELKKNKPKIIQQTLVHGDFTIDNVLVHNRKISGVIDWSSGALGDPRYDVALAVRPKPQAFETAKDKQIFYEGYGAKLLDKSDYNYFKNGLYEFF
nr:phosphotransferase [Lysinibacillus cavernae]